MHIDIHTRFITLLGDPLAQSFAARMQNRGYEAAGLNLVYFYTITGQEHLGDIVNGLRYMPVAGFAVTKPNKVKVLEYLDELDPLCRKMGSSNTVVKLPFSLRMIKASFYAIDEELEDAARNLGSSGLRTFLQVKLPIILPSVLAVFALNFNALFTEYDMSATFQSPNGITYAMVIQGMLADASRGANMNALGRRCASTVFIMIVSGLILYLVYGVGSRDLGERLDAKKRWRDRFDRLTGKRKKALKA